MNGRLFALALAMGLTATAAHAQTDKLTEVFLAGRYLDTIVLEDGRPLFSEKLCVYVSSLIPNSLIIPV